MTIDLFTRRLGSSIGLGGGFLLLAAFGAFVTGGQDAVVGTIHHMIAFVLASFGVVFTGIGLALSAAVPDPGEQKGLPDSDGKRD